jgi:hypothetical protein
VAVAGRLTLVHPQVEQAEMAVLLAVQVRITQARTLSLELRIRVVVEAVPC